jgi:hypothetical protein
MTKRTTLLIVLCLLAGVLALADVYRPRTTADKVAEAELIVRGVATLEGLPLAETEHPVKRQCRIMVLETLWPTNQLDTNSIVVSHWAWTKWPDTWWNYNSQTGVYFFVRTTTALKETRADMKSRGNLDKIGDDFFGTNVWIGLDRFDDWYEPATSITTIQRLIKESKH